jgi:hypothetical protein
MAAISELASTVGTIAACRALDMPRASYLPESSSGLVSPALRSAAIAGACPGSSGTRNGLGASARRALPGSLASRGVCDLAR